MNQLELHLMGCVEGPRMIPMSDVLKIKSYAEAVSVCWSNRRVAGMTKTSLAALTGMRPSHLTDYFSIERVDSQGRELREMPAKYIPAFEMVTGNTCVSQWLLSQGPLSVLLAAAA